MVNPDPGGLYSGKKAAACSGISKLQNLNIVKYLIRLDKFRIKGW